MGENDKISTANYKKYTTILNEVIEGLSRVHHDLSESLLDGHRVEAKFKAAVISLRCIDRKYRSLLFNNEPPCVQCTTEYLESKKKEREEVRQKLQAMRKEYYMQEEHMSKLSHTLQETEKDLAVQSIRCTREGLLVSRLLWIATKPRSILEKLTSECATQLHDFLNLAEGCIYAFAATYKDSMPDPCTDEYQYVISLCGVLTNLSSIPEGRLFLMWNPFGRAIYTLIFNIIGSISGNKAGSLKWMILIVIYNILVNPLGRKFMLKHTLLYENLEGCLLPPNCPDITGAALHIIKIFVDDFIDDNDMVSVLMYQLPLKQVFFLSQSTNDVNIRKIALAIVSRLKKRMLDCYNCSSRRKTVSAGSPFSTPKQMKRKKQGKHVAASVMTSNMSICAEFEADDTEYANSGTEKRHTIKKSTSCSKTRLRSSILVKLPESKPYTRKISKKKPPNDFHEICETPSLKAKGTKKIAVKTLFKPSTSKVFNISCVELRARSTGKLEGVPPLKRKSKSEELISASRNKLMNVDRKTVINMLSKLDLDTYLRPSYDGIGIPLKSNDCPYCCKRTGKSFEEKVNRKTADPTTCTCKKTTDKGKCGQLVCVCDEIARRQATRLNATKGKKIETKDCTCFKGVKQLEIRKEIDGTKEICSCINIIEGKEKCGQQVCVCAEIVARQAKTQSSAKKSMEINKTEKQLYHDFESEEVCVCSEGNKTLETPLKVKEEPIIESPKKYCICFKDDKQSSKKMEGTKEACACMNTTGENYKCSQQVCVCAEIAERHAAQKGPWSPSKEKESKKFIVDNFKTDVVQEVCICHEKMRKPVVEKIETVTEVCLCPEEKITQVKSTNMKKVEKTPVRFESQECCICSEDINQLKALKMVGGTNEACACINITEEKGKCGQQVCVCAEIAARHAQAQKGPWSTGKEKKSKKSPEEDYNPTKALNKTDGAQEVCTCSEEKSKQEKSTKIKKTDTSPARFESQECYVCSEDFNQLKAFKKVEAANETCEEKGKCGQQVCVCAEIAARHAQAQKGPWSPDRKKESKKLIEENYNPRNASNKTNGAQEVCICPEERKKSFEEKMDAVTEACLCPEEKTTQVQSTKIKTADKSPVRFNSQDYCVCSENTDYFEISKKEKSTNSARVCMNKGHEKAICGQQVCVYAEISAGQAQRVLWSPNAAKEPTYLVDILNKTDNSQEMCICSEEMSKVGPDEKSNTKYDTVADAYLGPDKTATETETVKLEKTVKSKKNGNLETCICSEDTRKQAINLKSAKKASVCMNKTVEQDKCCQQLCVCAEIAERQARAKKGEWLPQTKDNKSAEREAGDKKTDPLNEKCICSSETGKPVERKATATSQENAIEMKALSVTKLHASSSNSSPDGFLSVHSKLIIRKTSGGVRRKRKISYSKVDEDKSFNWEDICSCPTKPKEDRTICGDDCEACIITLPIIDIANLANETKSKEQQERADAGGNKLVPCGCNHNIENTKADVGNEQKLDSIDQPQSEPETKAEAVAHVEDKNQTDKLDASACPSKCKTK